MNYQYKVYRETEIGNLQTSFNYYASIGYRVISVVWDNDDSCFVTTLERAN